MSISLAATVRCDHIDKGERCDRTFVIEDPSIDVCTEQNSYGESYSRSEPWVPFQDGWEKKSYGSSMHLAVTGDFCPDHAPLYPLPRDVKLPF